MLKTTNEKGEIKSPLHFFARPHTALRITGVPAAPMSMAPMTAAPAPNQEPAVPAREYHQRPRQQHN